MSRPEPDPSKIGVVPQPPFAILPQPAALFARRAERLRFLGRESQLGAYLLFLAGLAEAQARLAGELPPVSPVSEAARRRARDAAMPAIDGAALARGPDQELAATLDALLEATAALEMPAAARASREPAEGGPELRAWLFGNVVGRSVDPAEAAAHLWPGAAVELHFARLAATLDAGALVPVRTGICPCCGGVPAVSLVTEVARLEGIRYAVCGTCLARWNEVRVKCLGCGSTKGIGYRALGDEAVIRAETCSECNAWMKVLYQTRDPALDPVADDVASLGLNLRMAETGLRRASFSPYLIGH